MRIFLLTATAAMAVASPAAARDGQPYFGVEGGLLFPKDQDADIDVDFTTTQTPAAPVAPAGPGDTSFNNAIGIDYRRGVDLDAIVGYDFGAFRLEGEAGFKRARLDEFEIDGGLVTALNTALNRPSAVPDPGAPGLAPLVATDFTLDGRVRVVSGMINGLLDFGDEEGLSFYAGAGVGRARVRFAGARDAAWAGQLIAGARFAITSNIDVGLKYRHFRTRRLDLADDSGVNLLGNANRFVLDPTNPTIVNQTTNANLFANFEQRFRSHSLLASLIFNFGAPPAPPPPPPPPVVEAPPPPPPATQTCPDGSVILATDTCPLPPPPPPPPEPAPERG
ncbi:MAG: Outer membrane protein A precursor [uncultured Sphingomonas sp.]|uniref:Outer membrane protein A n=1 Tax=uncultured Sphingomonas sp. TaxID=158754 RepID=A0A6J4T378_9SPHN|nr:outer membrane beta-barrel protein [uncultured Sphingomonas sp.]CAA9512027.1 MAG: Outer membrane protein A precursor [uncultured Sphingomonas sp.]